jgi:predicted aldo/keto reductase-like oxidoreductase
MTELNEFLLYENKPPLLDSVMQNTIESDKAELCGSFCRCCGYCLPCPIGIPINNAARIIFLVKRAVKEHWLSPEWQKNMRLIDDCTGCGHCKKNCPYGLDVPALLKFQQEEYFKLLAADGNIDKND